MWTKEMKRWTLYMKAPDTVRVLSFLLQLIVPIDETHDHFRTSGCLDVLLRLFSEHNQDEGVVFRLIRVLANLATNKENRLVIGESHAIEDMIYYLDARWNAEIRGIFVRISTNT